MKAEILISGFGGQGLMSLGKILAKAAALENKYSVWFPSYGAEMRGGTAYCFVKISSSPIHSPFIVHPDIAVILNQPSLDKFKEQLKKQSLLILNADLIDNHSFIGAGIKKINLPLNKMALECGSIKAVNTVALGVLISLQKSLIRESTVIKILEETFNTKESLGLNLSALSCGKQAACGYKKM